MKKNSSQGAKHGRTKEQYDHFKANESMRHAKKKRYDPLRLDSKATNYTEIPSSPSDGPKNIVNIWIRSWQLISHTQRRGKSVSDMRTVILSASMVQGRNLDQRTSSKQNSGSEKTSGESKSVFPKTFTIIEERERLEQQWKRWRRNIWSRSSSSSSTWWMPQEWQD